MTAMLLPCLKSDGLLHIRLADDTGLVIYKKRAQGASLYGVAPLSPRANGTPDKRTMLEWYAGLAFDYDSAVEFSQLDDVVRYVRGRVARAIARESAISRFKSAPA